MMELLRATFQLYARAFQATILSFVRGWVICLAVVGFVGLMALAAALFGGLGIAGGFILGAVNALLVGATLALIEDAVKAARPIRFHDLWQSLGTYFWDVIGVGFVLWIPLMLLQQALAANPSGAFLGAAVLLLLFILLNAVPEVIYQVRHDSPLDVFRESYQFIVENWIEWFLPVALVIAPFGAGFFFHLSELTGGRAGLDVVQLLAVPLTLLTAWLTYLGVPVEAGSVLVLILTPPVTVVILLFRGHLFAALHGSSRRQRMFRSQFGNGS